MGVWFTPWSIEELDAEPTPRNRHSRSGRETSILRYLYRAGQPVRGGIAHLHSETPLPESQSRASNLEKRAARVNFAAAYMFDV
jgi:hypothetical protein